MSETILKSVASEIFRNQLSQSVDGWVALEQTRGETIAKYREYADGEHDAKLTPQMRRTLRLSTVTDTVKGVSSFDEMTTNYIPAVIQAPADRLSMEAITAENEAASEWIKQILLDNRVDGFQMDVHEAALRDGDTYIMVDWDEDSGRVRWTHEPAYDGVAGVVALYADRKMILAIKLWHVVEDDDNGSDVTFINVYHPDRIEKFVANEGGQPRPRPLPDGETNNNPMGEHVFDWKDRSGQPIGIPFIHFRNRATTYGTHGRSEVSDAIPPQNALNRTIYSMIMTAELSAFPVRVARGFTPPAQVTPAMWINISPKAPIPRDKIADASVLPQADLVPYIEQAKHLKAEIFDVTNTPQRDDVSSTASGERLKQQEIGLTGKVKRFQVKAGNAWEDAAETSARVQNAFGNQQAPAFERFTSVWKEAELRNDTEVLKAAREDFKAGLIDHQTYLEIVAPIRGWDKTQIDQILQRTREEKQQSIEAMASAMMSTNPPPSSNGNTPEAVNNEEAA